MKKIYIFILFYISILSANAQTFTNNGINYNITSSTTVEVGNNASFTGDANIPSTVVYNSNNYTITSIANNAFFTCTGVTSITIPNSVTNIGATAFGACTGLTSITIPNSVTNIGNAAFSGCTGLTSVTMPNSITNIKNDTFYNCFSLTSITIPNSVTNIGNSAFAKCSGLTSITIPNSVTNIGNSAFSDCTGLTNLIIPNSVTNIGLAAFYRCNNLTTVTLPNGITTIQQSTFQYCNQLVSITIPNSVTTIGNDAFRYNTALNSLIIPNSVTSIGSFAFGSNYSLIDVTIPSSVTSIGDYAFAYLYSLNSFTVNWQTPLPIGSNFFEGTNINGKTLNVPAGTENLYEISPVWTEFNITDGAPRGCWANLSAGGQHTLAIAQDGTLWAWGDNSYGQLGNNNATGTVANPLQISNDPNWVFVSAGEFYSLAIKKDGTLWAWGENSYGQIGNGNTTQLNIPTQIGTDTNWIGIYAGFDHSMARKSDNSLWTWGNNLFGQLGIGNTTQQNTPVQVGNDTNWQLASLGRRHTVALKNNGELWSWGRNNYGQLGIGNITQQLTPVQIGTETTWKTMEVGEYHTIALKNNGTIYSWGENGLGQLGLGDTTNRNSPTQIGTATNWKFIAAGLYNGYATKSIGTLYAWGDNFNGQVGNGNFLQQNSPVQVGTATDWYNVMAGNSYGIAQKSTGTFLSWGDNQSGQLGNGSTLPNTTGQNAPGVMGCAGNILAFDGVNDAVMIPSIGTGILGNNSNNESYTVEMKVKFNSLNTNNILFAKYNLTPIAGFIIFTDSNGILQFGQSYGATFSMAENATPLSINTWYRIVATFDYVSKTHKLYINGSLVDTKTETGTPNFSTLDSGIGRYYETDKFDGQMNDLRVWNIARTPTEVSSYTRNTQEQTDASNLLVHFKFNQGIANANNAGLTVLANEVVGSPYVGTLQNFALTGNNSNWTIDTTANETLHNNNFVKTNDLLLYPNPSNGYFTIEAKEELTIKVFDLVGKLIYTSNVSTGKNNIDINNYKAGVYVLNATNNSGKTNTVKLIKN